MKYLDIKKQIKLNFDANIDGGKREKIIKNLSGISLTHQGKYLWLGTDEFSAIERLTKLENEEFGKHQRFYFKDFVDGFDEAKGEVDIEAIAFSAGYLWIIGSHSSKRKKVDIESDKFKIEKKELKKIERQENRYLLVRIPVNQDGILEESSPKRGWLKRDGCNDALTQALADDEYLNLSKLIESDDQDNLPGKEFYFYLPSKENGLDIEGLAVQGNKIFIGLRGPVLRGIALLLEIEIEEGDVHELKLKEIGDDQRLYKRHFLALDGLGIRDLCFEEASGDLLILAGPTMDLDASHSLFRLKQPFTLSDNSLSSQPNQQLEYLGDIPHGHKCDRAEGLTLYGEEQSVLVVYDSPNENPEGGRIIFDDQHNIVGVYTDLFQLTNSGNS